MIKKSLTIGIMALWLLSVPLTDNAFAQDAAGAAAAVAPNPIDTGDTAWMLVSSALVLLMTPGTGLFLRGTGAIAQRPQHHDDELSHDGSHRRHLDAVGLQFGF
ncbi:hypothetical protein [Microcoleus vaginatus]|uniref:hypothetical protein n=1 Tax=Microcoleus vaginatus TaxID=119532 RepID=UPI00403F42C0